MIDFTNYKGCSVDVTGLCKRFGAERTMSLLRLFITESEVRVAELERGIKDRNVPVVTMVAHSLKGVSSMLKATSIENLSRRIETQASCGDWYGVAALMDDLKREFAILQRDMGPDLYCDRGS